MATADDIDTKQAVGKFLQRRSVTPKADDTANTADEVTAVLQTVAMAFLLYPQAALAIVMNAKNSFQQVVQADLDVVNFLLTALIDVNNRDVPVTDASDLINAQTALVELDRLGRVDIELQAFTRYQNSINNFLNKQLAPTLKRNGTGTFERTGTEARQDIFGILPQFIATHEIMASALKALQGSVADFQSVNLTNLVSAQTITQVRSSLNRLKSRVDAGTISKTTLAIELLSGSSALLSISNTADVFDPTIETGSLPAGTNVTARFEAVQATALSTEGSWTLGAGPWRFAGTMDPLSVAQVFNFQIPGPGAGGRAYISSEGLTSTFNVPANSHLYLHLAGASATEVEVALTTGPSVSLATLIGNINSALGSDGSCIQNPMTNGFLIFGSGSVTQIVVRSAATGSSGTYNANPSAHALLGFIAGQTSLPVHTVTAQSLLLAIHNQLPSGDVTVEGNKLRLTSTLDDSTLSSIFFNGSASNAVQGSFGFTGTVESQPSYLELLDDTEPQSPEDLGVYIGGIVTTAEIPAIPGSTTRSLNNEAITDIQDTKLFFGASTLPRGTRSLTVTAPVVSEAQDLISDLAPLVGTFDEDTANTQRVLSPIISSPTPAQLGDARRVITDIRDRLQSLVNVLDAVVVRTDRSQYADVASQIMSALGERGLDRAQDLLTSGQFSQFFALDSSNSSKSNRLLTAMETVATQDLPISVKEIDIDDSSEPRGTNPNSSILSGAELQGAGTLVNNG